MIEITNVAVKGKHVKPIVTDIFYKKNEQLKPIVIFCHGYKGYKDWGSFGKMPSLFTDQDLFFIKFNFSHNGGTLEQPIDFPDLEAFGQNNFIKELDDLESIIDWISENPEFSKEADLNNITLIGHSRGGGIVLLKASEDTRISKVISWAGVSDYASRFPEGEILDFWKKEGVAYIENTRTKQQMPHYIQFYNNFKENEARLNIQTAVKKIEIPLLIAHGTQDTSVTIDEAMAIRSWNSNAELVIIEGADHVFGSKQPWEEDYFPEHFTTLVDRTIDFIKRN